MKTSMQELIDSLKREPLNPSNEWRLGYQKALINVIKALTRTEALLKNTTTKPLTPKRNETEQY